MRPAAELRRGQSLAWQPWWVPESEKSESLESGEREGAGTHRNARRRSLNGSIGGHDGRFFGKLTSRELAA